VAPLIAQHRPEVAAIYEAGIATGDATFETSVPSWEQWHTSHRPDLRVVTLDGEKVIGWTAAAHLPDRCCYTRVVEHGVYVGPDHRRHGVGRVLLHALISAAEHAGVWTIQTDVFPENTASLAHHQHGGFRIVGIRERLGQLNGV
jgi:L-amino acid N-acyltransferase YncA